MDSELQRLMGVGQADQLAAGFSSAARAIWAYFCALQALGFTEDQALRIAIAWQAAAIGRSTPSTGGDGS